MTRSARPADDDGSPQAASRRTVGTSSSRKVLQLLLSYSERRAEASVAELAEAIGVPVATAYRYVALLKELQLLEEGRAGYYHVTSQVMPLARAAQIANDLARLARPIMEDATLQLRETVMLFQHFGAAAVCADRVECDRAMRFTFQPGHSLPLGVGASGKMLLAGLPEAEQDRLLPELARERPDLREEIAQAAADRYAVSWGELDDGVWACSVPISAPQHRPTVLSMAGPAARISEDAKRAAIASLHSYASRIRAATAAYAL
jgi:DNA-binding IclR family transcriptional regulator